MADEQEEINLDIIDDDDDDEDENEEIGFEEVGEILQVTAEAIDALQDREEGENLLQQFMMNYIIPAAVSHASRVS